jgi:hypothetical protein
MAIEVGKDRAKKFSGHGTNKGFDRYCQIADDETFDMAQLMAKNIEQKGQTYTLTKIRL